MKYELLFDILVISINVLTYAAFISGIIEWIMKKVGKNDNA